MKNKHAMIITAYNDFDVLQKLLMYYNDFYDCYVHIDKRSNVPINFYQVISKLKNVHIIKKYRIFWGSYKHILAVLDLLAMAKAGGYSYYHVLTGNTFPVCSNNEIHRFFKENSGMNYIEIKNVKGNEVYEDRQKYYYFFHLLNMQSSIGKRINEKLIILQRRLSLQRTPCLGYKGYFYCHLDYHFTNYVLDYVKKHRGFIKKLKTMAIPEEFFFQNIIMDSPYGEFVVNDSLIYDDWENGNGASPAVLKLDDMKRIESSGKLFARKICDLEMANLILSELDNT